MITDPESKLTVGIVGFGKIAKDQHLPAIRDSERFRLHSVADTVGAPAQMRCYPDIESMLAADDAPDAIAICTPPQVRYHVARHALARGKHVLLEKPPGTTLSEVEDLRVLAERSGLTLFCAWHSPFAAAVAPARDWLAERTLRQVRIDWREDVRVWHPNQTWIWEAGGFGVFDPGINALSVAEKILPRPLRLRDALLKFPANRATPIAAQLTLSDADDIPVTASFDWLHTGPPTWAIEVDTDSGHLLLAEGGSRLVLDGEEMVFAPNREYPALYTHFGRLIASARSDVDIGPLRLVADAFMRGRRETVTPFHESALTRPAHGESR